MGVLLCSLCVGSLFAPVIAGGLHSINQSFPPLILYTSFCLIIASIVTDIALGEKSLHRKIYFFLSRTTINAKENIVSESQAFDSQSTNKI